MYLQCRHQEHTVNEKRSFQKKKKGRGGESPRIINGLIMYEELFVVQTAFP